MAELIWQDRKSPVLSRPSLPCIAAHHTINLTAGCIFACRYCYAQGYRGNLGPGKIIFYRNSLARLQQELPRKKVRPSFVYFSTACEPFAPFAPVLDELYGIMELLLSHAVNFNVSTKAHLPARFLRLFSRFPGQVFVQVGITTVDDRVRKIMEPHASPVRARLDNIRRLTDAGIAAEARMDPLLPGITDTDEVLAALFRALAERGLKKAVASYVFVRDANRGPLNAGLRQLGGKIDGRFTERISDYCGGSAIEVAPRVYREKRYARLAELAREHGMVVKFCACKNPGLTKDLCHPEGAFAKDIDQRELPF